MNISDEKLKEIYGTLVNLEEFCDKSKECWKEIPALKLGSNQKPYKPYLGKKFDGLMFAGINLNGGNEAINAIDHLVEGTEDAKGAKHDLNDGKYLLFKQPGYRGSPFYYYVPLLSFLYYSYSKLDVKFTKEGALTREQKISGFDYCGLTNLIKCSTNSPDGRSKPSEAMYSNCIKKFENELDVICPKILIIFTLYNHPSLLVDYFSGFGVISENEKERYRIQKKDNLYVLELEHPVSTKIKREMKYQSYSNAIYELVELQKQQ